MPRPHLTSLHLRADDQAIRVMHPPPPVCPGTSSSGEERAPDRGLTEIVVPRLVTGSRVGTRAHRVDEPDARQDRRAAAEQCGVRSGPGADESQPLTIGIDPRRIAMTPALEGARVEEIDLEEVAPLAPEPSKDLDEVVGSLGVGHVQGVEVLVPVMAGEPVANEPL